VAKPFNANGANYLMTLLITSSNRAGSNGFTSQPVAPAARPACFIKSLDSVVKTNIGTVLNWGCSLNFRVNPKPSSLGMF
jgi:hypothetical protein